MEQLKLSKDIAKIHQMFGKKLYSNKYSFISELCQNAVDSHRMAGVKEPIEVGIRQEESGGQMQFTFYVKDFGLSFESKEDFVEKICTIAESGKSATKTTDEDCPMGMHGIGSISVSGYNSDWRYTVVKNRRKFHAKLSEIEGKGLNYSLSDYEDTDEDKYVLFEVDMIITNPYIMWSELNTFIVNMQDKLCYFKDIKFVFPDYVIKTSPALALINSTFKLYQSDDFQISTLNRVNEMHISLDQYAYKISWHDLGIKPINLPIALKFSMGEGLSADMTRENLIMDENYVRLVKEKIVTVADWFVNKYNASVAPTESIVDLEKQLGKGSFLNLIDKDYNVMEISPHSRINLEKPSFKGVEEKVLNAWRSCKWGRDLYRKGHVISDSGYKYKVENDNSFHGWSNGYYNTEKHRLLYTKEISRNKISYLKETYKSAGIYYKRTVPLKTKEGLSYFNLLGLPSKSSIKDTYKKTGVNLWRKQITQFQLLEKALEKETMIDIESVEVPDNFFAKKTRTVYQKEKVDFSSLQGEVTMGYANKCQYNETCKYTNKVVKLKDLSTETVMTVYGKEEDKERLGVIFQLTNYSAGNKCNVAIVSNKTSEILSKVNFPNFMEVKEFYKCENDVLKKALTAYMISSRLLVKYRYTILTPQGLDIIRDFCPQMRDDIDQLTKYFQKNKYSGYEENHVSSQLFKDLLDHAEKALLVDEEAYTLMNKVKEDVEKFNFIPFVQKENKPQFDQVLKDIIASRRSMDWKNYTV